MNQGSTWNSRLSTRFTASKHTGLEYGGFLTDSEVAWLAIRPDFLPSHAGYPLFVDDPLAQLARCLDGARSVAVVTGAGISAESRIPTFRDAMDGLWAEFDPQTLATPEAFAADPERVTRWYDHRRMGCLAAEPNAGHMALTELERRVRARGGEFWLLTQNVDGLHRRAGSERVYELHGSVMRWRCSVTGREVPLPPTALEDFPPRSPLVDGGLLRPSVVWFGESLPSEALMAAEEAVRSCDVFLSAGTSSLVYPAAGFIRWAASRGAKTAEVNLEETPISGSVGWSIRGRCGEVLPRVLELMEG